jgi:hypothetical protein
MTSAPTQVQWYKKWSGPNPWVSCHRKGDRIQMCFSVAGDWAGKRIEELAPGDIEGAADRVWGFIFPSAGVTSTHSG